jgi:glycosyltransferase involved in cell wall biosynthesis
MKISVIVPTYNQARYLPACLDSVWFQDHPEVEIVVVNDGSTDRTGQILKDYQARLAGDQVSFASHYDAAGDELERVHHPRYPKQGRELRVITHERNQGLAAALNTGFKACTGQACTYVPSDDWCLPNMLSELEAALVADKADFAYADMLIVDDAFQVVRRFDLPDYSFERCFANWYLCGVCKLYRTGLHQVHGYYDQNLLAHDHELFLRFAMAGARFTHVPKSLMAVRDHAKGREVHIHAPANWNRLIGESKRLVDLARRHAALMAREDHGN